MKIEELVRRATSDLKYAARLRELAYKSRDEGMESRAYKTLARELAETPADLAALNSTMGYTMMIQFTSSKLAMLCNLVPQPPTHTGLPVVTGDVETAPAVAAKKAAAKPRNAAARKSASPRAPKPRT